MGNGIPCKYCGKQCTDHNDNPLKLPVLQHALELRARKDFGDFVCDKYNPDIKKGDLECTCNKNQHQDWCNGFCDFSKVDIEQD